MTLTPEDMQDVVPKNKDLFTDQNGNNWLVSYRFPSALQSEVLFECLVLYTLSQLPPKYRPFHATGETCLKLRASVLKKLHLRLQDPQLCQDDTTLHSVIMLIGSDVQLAVFAYFVQKLTKYISSISGKI